MSALLALLVFLAVLPVHAVGLVSGNDLSENKELKVKTSGVSLILSGKVGQTYGGKELTDAELKKNFRETSCESHRELILKQYQDLAASNLYWKSAAAPGLCGYRFFGLGVGEYDFELHPSSKVNCYMRQSGFSTVVLVRGDLTVKATCRNPREQTNDAGSAKLRGPENAEGAQGKK